MSELKTVLAREGRSARNLNNYIVPIKDENNTENSENKQNSTQNRSNKIPSPLNNVIDSAQNFRHVRLFK